VNAVKNNTMDFIGYVKDVLCLEEKPTHSWGSFILSFEWYLDILQLIESKSLNHSNVEALKLLAQEKNLKFNTDFLERYIQKHMQMNEPVDHQLF
jgi:hypothetical protein